jgi:putative FmdB family regulatory protein
VPTYQYACTECGEQLEKVQSFSDPALTECPACQGKLRKVFNSVGIVFKGSGFYRNDSRDTKTGSSSSSSSSDSASSPSSDGAGKPSSTSTDNGGSGSSKTETKSTPAATDRKASAPVAS